MAETADYVVQYRRKREGRTDYKKRLDLLKAETTRLVVRPSNKHIRVQLVDYKTGGDLVVAAACSKDLAAFGWTQPTGNVPAAYLTGMLCGLRGQKKGVKMAVMDIGLLPSIKGSRLYAALKGAKDSGLKISVGEEILPDEKRISGEHIKNDKITKDFASAKEKIAESFKK